MGLLAIKHLLFVMLLMTSVVHADKPLQVFDKNTYQAILKNENQQAFLLVLWSLDCPPCMEELSVLAEIHQQYPDKKLILLSVDAESQHDDIRQVVNKFGLATLPQWVFGNDAPQYLRYSIDPMWYGELPRSYFHTTEKRTAVSGKLNKATLLRWFNAG